MSPPSCPFVPVRELLVVEFSCPFLVEGRVRLMKLLKLLCGLLKFSKRNQRTKAHSHHTTSLHKQILQMATSVASRIDKSLYVRVYIHLRCTSLQSTSRQRENYDGPPSYALSVRTAGCRVPVDRKHWGVQNMPRERRKSDGGIGLKLSFLTSLHRIPVIRGRKQIAFD